MAAGDRARASRFTAARARAQRPLVVLATAMAALVCLALGGTSAYLDVAATDGVRTALAQTPAAERTLVLQTRVSSDPESQRTAAEQVLAGRLPADAVVTTTQRTPAVPLLAPTTDLATGLVLVADDGAAAAADLVDGAWPAADDEVALTPAAAEYLDLAVGDTLTLDRGDGVEVRVVGLWLPTDAGDARWAGDPLLDGGVDPALPGATGPGLMTAAGLATLDADPFVRWVVAPDPDLEPDDLDTLRAALLPLADALDDTDGVVSLGLTTSGTLPETLAELSATVSSTRSGTLVPLLVTGVLAAVAIWQMARLLAVTRSTETQILLARGASGRQLVRMGAVEGAAVATGAVLAGAAVAVVLGSRDGFSPLRLLLLTLGVALAVVALLTLEGASAVRRGAGSGRDSGRLRTTVTGAALVATLVAAVFAMARLVGRGSTVLPGGGTDLVAVAAPALFLVAAAILALGAVGPLTRAAAALARPLRSYSPVAELRQVARRVTVNAVPVVLLVLATATGTVAAAHQATSASLDLLASEMEVGADVRVDLGAELVGAVPRGVAGLGGLAGADGVTGVLQAPADLDDGSGTLSALTTSERRVSAAPAEVLDAVAALVPAQDPLPGLAIDPGTATVQIDLRVETTRDENDTFFPPAGLPLRLSAWFAGGGELIEIPAGSVLTSRLGGVVTQGLAVDLPEGSWRLVAVDAILPTVTSQMRWDVAVESLTADGTDLLAGGEQWDPGVLPPPSGTEPYQPGDTALSVRTTLQALGAPSTARVRLMLPDALTGDPVVPVLTTPGAAALLPEAGADARVGNLTLRLQPVGSLGVIPGSTDPVGVLADLPTLQAAMLRTGATMPTVSQAWFSSTPAERDDLVAAIRERLGPTAQVDVVGGRAADAITAPVRGAYWVCAIAGLLLAAPALVATALAQARERRGEVVTLRAVGVGSSQHARSRRRELLALQLFAVVVGAAAGLALALLVVVDLVRAASPEVPAALPLPLTVAVGPWAAALAAAVVVSALTAAWYGARVRRQARDTTWRAEVR